MKAKKLSHVSIIVRDQEEALRWYSENFGFEKRTDDSTTIPGFRWLTAGVPGEKFPEIALFQPRREDTVEQIGKGTMWVLSVADCRAACTDLKARGVNVTTEPEELPWGISAVVEDLYGNHWNLLEPR